MELTNILQTLLPNLDLIELAKWLGLIFFGINVLVEVGRKLAPYTETKKDDVIFTKAAKILPKIFVFLTANKLMTTVANTKEVVKTKGEEVKK